MSTAISMQLLKECQDLTHPDDPSLINSLINEGNDINYQDIHTRWTPLIVACCSKKENIALELLNRENINITLLDSEGLSALAWAAKECNSKVVRKILEKGGNPNHQDKHYFTPLFFAVGNGNEENVRVLLSHPKINVNLTNMYGGTALHHSAYASDNVNIVTMLVNAGADLWLEDDRNKKAIDVALKRNHLSVYKYLLDIMKTKDPSWNHIMMFNDIDDNSNNNNYHKCNGTGDNDNYSSYSSPSPFYSQSISSIVTPYDSSPSLDLHNANNTNANCHFSEMSLITSQYSNNVSTRKYSWGNVNNNNINGDDNINNNVSSKKSPISSHTTCTTTTPPIFEISKSSPDNIANLIEANSQLKSKCFQYQQELQKRNEDYDALRKELANLQQGNQNLLRTIMTLKEELKILRSQATSATNIAPVSYCYNYDNCDDDIVNDNQSYKYDNENDNTICFSDQIEGNPT